jgi:hypothetical protein
MWSIYPTQIDAIVEAMKPDMSEVKKASRFCSQRKTQRGVRFSTKVNCTTAQLTAASGQSYSAPASPASTSVPRQLNVGLIDFA